MVRLACTSAIVRRRALILMLSLIGTVGWQAGSACGQSEATSSRAARANAIDAIPFDELNRAAQEKMAPILQRPSIYRRLPVETITCDPDLHVFMVRYPEVIVNIWQLMEVTQVSTRRTGPFTLVAADGAGTECTVELVYGTPDLHIFYAEGTYSGSLFPRPLSGRCVMVLRSEFGTDRAGRPLVRNQLDAFLKVDNLAADLIAKTIHPLVGHSADHNFVETTRFLSRMWEATEANSVGVQHMVNRLDEVQPEVRRQFGQVVAVTGARAASRWESDAGDSHAATTQPYDRTSVRNQP